MSQPCTRREFLAEAGRLTGSTLLGAGSMIPLAEMSPPGTLPRRRLGRTGVEVSILGMGLAPLGMANYSPDDFRMVVRAALDEGVGDHPHRLGRAGRSNRRHVSAAPTRTSRPQKS